MRQDRDGIRHSHKFLVLTRHYSPEPTGSAPVIKQIAEWLAAHDYPVEVLTVRPNYPTNKIFPGYEHGQKDSSSESNVEVRRFKTSLARGSSVFGRLGPEVEFMARVIARYFLSPMTEDRCVISLCPSILTCLGGLLVGRRSARHIIVVHDIQSGLGSALSSGLMRKALHLLRAAEVFTFNRVDQLVVLSAAMRSTLRSLGVKTPIIVLPPSVDTATIKPGNGSPGRPFTVLYSGNLGRKQGLEQLVEFSRLLGQSHPSIRIIIRGDGALRPWLAAQLAAARLENTQLLPLVSQEAYPESLLEGDVHLVPQLPAGGDFAIPSKAYSIMAAGRPFIATAPVGSPLSELAAESQAFICVPPGQAGALVDATIMLAQNPAFANSLGRNGRRYAELVADTDVVMRRLLEVALPA